ncbi:MAG: RAQPRD family integrative conjugative element protein [Gammaproteobacteria bacterium]|nr:RAQPRD family integrative conjugative element protein [Gammaproteobacteria bacterium]
MKRIALIIEVISVGLWGASLAYASIESERETLARLAQELRAIEPLIREAEQQRDPTSRIKFEYGWLSQDFEKVIYGIEEYLNNPRIEPRQVEPLRGDYRR